MEAHVLDGSYIVEKFGCPCVLYAGDEFGAPNGTVPARLGVDTCGVVIVLPCKLPIIWSCEII